jgi:hypothetical protein
MTVRRSPHVGYRYRYPDPECLVVVFDLREPHGAAELHRQRAAWAAYSDIEALDEHHFVLLIRQGGAL